MKSHNPKHTLLMFTESRTQIAGLHRVFQLALEWNSRLGLTPTLMATEHDSKLVKFSNAVKKRDARGYSEESSFSLFSLPADVQHELEGYNSHFFLHSLCKQLIIDIRSDFCPFLETSFFQLAADF